MELHQVKRYWETRVELVSALKEGATSSLMTVLKVKTKVLEGVYVVDVEEASFDEPRAKGYTPTAASTSSPTLPLSRYTQATQAALVCLGAPPDLEPLRALKLHIQKEYKDFHRDQMQRTQDFRQEKDNTSHTMYTRIPY